LHQAGETDERLFETRDLSSRVPRLQFHTSWPVAAGAAPDAAGAAAQLDALLGLSRLSRWSPRCKQVLVTVDAYSLIRDHGRNPLTKYQDWSGTRKFLTHPRSKLAIVNATCELMAMEFGFNAHERELEKETCLQGSRQKYFERFRREFGHVIPKMTPVVDIPPSALLPPGVAMLDLFFTDDHVPVE
jgi:hypothetical protein